jgi:hypothetical protein
VPAGYGGAWSVLWLAAALTALAGYAVLAGPGAGWRAVWRAGAGPRWPGLGVAAVAGLVIASIGITGPGRDLLRAATGLWPGFSVLRDGQQFAAPLALAEAVGFGLAVGWAIRPRAARAARVARDTAAAGSGRPDPLGVAIGIAAILLPVLLLPGLAWGAAGRLRPVWYPASWLTAARLINESPVRGGALVLPWTGYRRLGWNHGETLLDPWPRLLGRTVIWNDGGQVGRIQLAPDDPRARRLDPAITGSGPLTSTFATAGVRFVIVDTSSAAKAAGRRLPGCRLLLTGRGLAVYQVPAR